MGSKGKMKFFHFKAFRNYLFSYIGIFFLVLSLMAIIMMKRTAENMKDEDIRLVGNKLHTIVEDLEIQMDAMQEIVMKVASAHIYSTDYFASHKYNEIELLEDFISYKRSTDICDNYFLYYHNSKTIFTSDESTTTFALFFGEPDDMEGGETLSDFMDRISLEARERVILYRNGDETLLLCPLKRYTFSPTGKDGVLGFRISEDKVRERIDRIVGSLNGALKVFYNDFCILDTEQVIANPEGKVEVSSQKGNFRICFYPEKGSYFSWGNVFSTKEIIMFCILAAVLFGVGYLLACWNFLPLRRITDKYCEVDECSNKVTPEWESLDLLIDSLLAGKEKSSKLFVRQYQILREQTIQRIANGGYSERVQEYMTLLNIQLEAAVFGVIICDFAEQDKMELNWDSLYKEVEDLSGNGIVLYAYWNYSSSLGVLAALEEEYQLQEATELLYALFEVKKTMVNIRIRSVTREIDQISQIETMQPLSEDEWGKNPKKSNSTAKAALHYIQENSSDYNLSLEMVAEKFQITPQHLSKIIKQQIDKSYKEYLTELRIETAKRLLEDPEASVMDVCFKSGYSNVSYFIRVFQKYTGKTPARYRDDCGIQGR